MSRIFDHIDLRVREFGRAAPFYRELLPLLGFTVRVDIPGWLQFEAPGREPAEFFGITEDPAHVANRSRIAFWAVSKERVDELASAIRAHGALNIEGPGFESPVYYAVYLTVTVTSGTAPTITAHPQSDTKNLGFDVVFGVSATGATPFTYQWKKAGTNITGATGATLTLLNISSTDGAAYSVVVTNSVASTLSNSATLTIRDPNADSDGDGIPNLTETALGTSATTTTSDGTNAQQQHIHRPTP